MLIDGYKEVVRVADRCGGKPSMSEKDSVIGWLQQLSSGDQGAARHLWERYFQRLVGLARKKLRDFPRRIADEEDVALSAFTSFCRGAEAGRFPHLTDSDSLWPLLVVITARKACDLMDHQLRLKRGGGLVQGESGIHSPEGSEGPRGIEQILGQEPTPQFAGQVTDEYERLMTLLGDDQLRSVAVWKMEGYTNEEIAGKLGCVERTVERKLRTIRGIWEAEEANPS
jgi:DNA-directed RNA polymerase specialized sigma24 family protein